MKSVPARWVPGVLCTFFGLFASLLTTPASAQTNTVPFSFPDRGGVSLTTSGTSSSIGVGHARLNDTGTSRAAGFAVFGLRQNNILVSEATVPVASLVSEGRIYAEIGGGVDTGVAIANPNSQPQDIGFYFTDSNGRVFGTNVITIPAQGQVAAFLSQAPFNGGSALLGTFTFFALTSDPNAKVGAIALRGITNTRGEFLMTTMPVTPVGQRGLFSGSVLPHFASGGGWTTQIVLVNPTDSEMAGFIAFSDQAGQAASVESEIGPGATFNYRIAPKSAWRLRTSASGALRVGSVRINSTAAGTDIPIGFLIFSFQTGQLTVAAAGVPPARPSTTTRIFVEAAGQFSTFQPGSLQTGFAISNAESSVPTRVSFELTRLDGSATGLRGELDIPAGGQVARFLTEIPGFSTLPVPFQGVLRISTPSTPVSVTGLRGRYNERAEFLITTVPTVNENDEYFNLALRFSNSAFPHFADGAGYTTQFVLFNGWTTGSVSGTLEFLTQSGGAFPLTLQAR